MASARGRPILLAHLFAAPLVRETSRSEGELRLVPVKQRDHARERDVITRY